MSDKPVVSIGMPLYNAASFVGEAIESLLNQTFSNFELLIADNCSTDNTVEVCRRFAATDRRIRIIERETNRGAIDNFNFVFSETSGKYFKWAAFDDVCAPTYLEKCVDVLDFDPTIGWCHCRSDLIDENGDSWLEKLERDDPLVESAKDGSRWWKGHPRKHFNASSPARRFEGVLLGTTWSVDSYGVIRRSLLEKTRMIVPLYGAEKVLMAEMSLYARSAWLNDMLFSQRVHAEASGNLTGRKQKRRFATAGRRSPFFSTRLSLLQSHAWSVMRSKLSFGDKAMCLGVIARYVLQPRKWISAIADVFSISRGNGGRQMIERASQNGAVESEGRQ
ncbi:MAG: glycosyltransferase family 2 protein [Planctomycetota bacterium]